MLMKNRGPISHGQDISQLKSLISEHVSLPIRLENGEMNIHENSYFDVHW